MSFLKNTGAAAGLASLMAIFSFAAAPPAFARLQADVNTSPATPPTTSIAQPPQETANPALKTGICAPEKILNEHIAAKQEKNIISLKSIQQIKTPLGAFSAPVPMVLSADQDSWTLVANPGSGTSCIIAQGDRLDFVSNRDKDMVLVGFQAAASRADTIHDLTDTAGAQIFLTAHTDDGKILDLMTTMDGSWAIVQSDARQGNADIIHFGSDYTLLRPEFQTRFGLYDQSRKTSALDTPAPMIR